MPFAPRRRPAVESACGLQGCRRIRLFSDWKAATETYARDTHAPSGFPRRRNRPRRLAEPPHGRSEAALRDDRARVAAGLRGRVEVWCDGGMKSAHDVAKLMCLGADRCGFGTFAMVSIGCTICRGCQLDTGHVGIATQIESAAEATARGLKRFEPQELERAVANLMRSFGAMREELAAIAARLGVERTADLVGRSDLLVQARGEDRVALATLTTPAVEWRRREVEAVAVGAAAVATAAEASGSEPTV